MGAHQSQEYYADALPVPPPDSVLIEAPPSTKSSPPPDDPNQPPSSPTSTVEVDDTLVSEEVVRHQQLQEHIHRLRNDPLYHELSVIRGTLRRQRQDMLKHTVPSPIGTRYPSLQRASASSPFKPTTIDSMDHPQLIYCGGVVQPSSRIPSPKTWRTRKMFLFGDATRVNWWQMVLIALLTVTLILGIGLLVGWSIHRTWPTNAWSCFPPSNHRRYARHGTCEEAYATRNTVFAECQAEFEEWNATEVDAVIAGHLRNHRSGETVGECEEVIGDIHVPWWYPYSHRSQIRQMCHTRCDDVFASSLAAGSGYVDLVRSGRVDRFPPDEVRVFIVPMCSIHAARQDCLSTCGEGQLGDAPEYYKQLGHICRANKFNMQEQMERRRTKVSAPTLSTSTTPHTPSNQRPLPLRYSQSPRTCLEFVDGQHCDRTCTADYQGTDYGGKDKNKWCTLAECVLKCIDRAMGREVVNYRNRDYINACVDGKTSSSVRRVYFEMLRNNEKTKNCEIH